MSRIFIFHAVTRGYHFPNKAVEVISCEYIPFKRGRQSGRSGNLGDHRSFNCTTTNAFKIPFFQLILTLRL